MPPHFPYGYVMNNIRIHQKKETPRRESKRGLSGSKAKRTKLTNKERKTLNKYVELLGEYYGKNE
jgi:hypothetical protein